MNLICKRSHRLRRAMGSLGLSLVMGLVGCGGGGDTGNTANASGNNSAGLSQAAQLGKLIFSDATLSASGKMACASCHNPENAHAQSNALSVQLGGANLDLPGFRAVPSLRYRDLTPAFFFAADGTPTGGFNWDGRAASLAAQAERPFLAAHEMANTSKADVVAKIAQTSYAVQFQQTFGATVLQDTDAAFNRVQFALQRFELEDGDFHPYDSKYDQFLAGRQSLTSPELRGLALFDNSAKGNCAACHPSARQADGSSPLFTDFSFDNLGVPRNPVIPATASTDYFDMGLCGPDRTDLSGRTDLCGKFKVPSLRNVATRKVFFHNGAFTTLRDVVNFYVRRDTEPALWYPLASDGSVDKFNDLPLAFRKNVNVLEVPYNRRLGMDPALSAIEIEELLQFLGTLTDGYKPP